MPTIRERFRSFFKSAADIRLEAAAAEAWQSAPRPVALATPPPFGPGQQPAPRVPSIDWMEGTPPPAPTTFAYRPGYSDHTFKDFSAPLAFEGFDLCAIRQTVALHRLGNFYQSSALMVGILGFAPVLAALAQAIAPILSLRRHVHGGDKGLAKLVASEVEDMLVPRAGLLPSPYFPPELFGTLAIYLRMMGFGVLQHVDGEPDEETGIRPRYTRIWEPWATTYYRDVKKWVAQTSEGTVEIKNDGHFTLVCDENEPHLTGAIVALGEETLGGKITQESRLSFLDFFGKPKLYATLPEKIATHGQAGDAFYAALETIYGPDGRGVLPYGSTLDAVSLSGEGSKAFQDALLDCIIHIYMVLTGSAGTIGSGGPTGAGPYQPQKGGPWNVRHDLIARPVTAIARGINGGHIAPYCDINYGEAIARAKRAGTWKTPVFDVPLPDVDRDERIDSVIKREEAFTEILSARRENNVAVEQEDANKLRDALELPHITLLSTRGVITEKDVEQKTFAIDEYRAQKGYGPLPDDMGTPEQLARERAKGRDETGTVKQTDEVDETMPENTAEEAA